MGATERLYQGKVIGKDFCNCKRLLLQGYEELVGGDQDVSEGDQGTGRAVLIVTDDEVLK